jgi:hypothetical protein
MPPLATAGALVHTLEESHPRETEPTLAGFHQRHQDAIAVLEAQVTGGTRLENELLTWPRDRSDPSSGRAPLRDVDSVLDAERLRPCPWCWRFGR